MEEARLGEVAEMGEGLEVEDWEGESSAEAGLGKVDLELGRLALVDSEQENVAAGAVPGF